MKRPVSDFDWTDLNTFLETARLGGASAAADRLRLDVTTVRRRLVSLENAVGRPLFVRAGRGMKLTPDGERIQAVASKMEALSREISHDVIDAARDLIGVVRVSTMEGFGSFYLAPRLSELVGRHPLLSVQLVASQTILNLAEREADLSLNLVHPEKGRLMVRRAGQFSVGLYGSLDYLETAGIPLRRSDLHQHAFITYVDELISVPHVRWLPDVIDNPRTRFASTSLVAQYEAACAGAGLAMLPHFMACRAPGLIRVMSADIDLIRNWWLVVHQDLQTVPRIRAVIDFISKVMKRDHAVLVG